MSQQQEFNGTVADWMAMTLILASGIRPNNVEGNQNNMLVLMMEVFSQVDKNLMGNFQNATADQCEKIIAATFNKAFELLSKPTQS